MTRGLWSDEALSALEGALLILGACQNEEMPFEAERPLERVQCSTQEGATELLFGASMMGGHVMDGPATPEGEEQYWPWPVEQGVADASATTLVCVKLV